MKAKVIIQLVLVVGFGMSSSVSRASDVNDIIIDTISPKKLELKGKIKMFKEFVYFAVDNNGVLQYGKMARDSDFVVKSKYKINKCYYFDINGYNIQNNEYWSPEKLYTIQKNTFQGKKLLQSSKEYRFSDGIKHSKHIYEYDDKGLITTSLLYNVYGRLASKTIYKYDSHNNIVWEREVDGDGEIESTKTTEYKYEGERMIYSKENENDENIIVRKWIYDTNGIIIGDYYQWDKVVWNSSYELNNNGKITKITCKNEKGEVRYTTSFNYNDNGELVEKNQLYSDGKRIVDVYDIENKKQTTTFFANDVVKNKKVYLNNNLIEYYDGLNTYEYKYTFDSKGNWIKSIEEKNSIPTYIKTRTIQYYP